MNAGASSHRQHPFVIVAEENKTKPPITRLLSEATSTVQPEVRVCVGVIGPGRVVHFDDTVARYTLYIESSSCCSNSPTQVVARGILAGVTRWSPYISVGFDGWMLSTLTVGMGPAGSLTSALLQISTLWLWRLIALCYTQSFYWTVARHSSGTAAATAAAYEPPSEPEAEAKSGGGSGKARRGSTTATRRSNSAPRGGAK